jgi:2-aminoethylphosphonate-pyruvate transaminase
MLNALEPIRDLARRFGKRFIVDAMSSFGGIPIDLGNLKADFLISSANKCLQGVPGFGFILARRKEMAKLANRARSLSLDLYEQWLCMEENEGKWRFTSPTHVVRAFSGALDELDHEGGILMRYHRYCENHRSLVRGMERLGFIPLLPENHRSPIITAFHTPEWPDFLFKTFYDGLKERGFVIYPGKVTIKDTFRIGTIGDILPDDIFRLLQAVENSTYYMEQLSR